MTHGSLFSGIGGFDLAAEWMGWENVFHCEFNPFGQRVLAHYWPESKLHPDVRKFDGRPYRGTIDVISGGFPCQPFSLAGKRAGTADERHLWPEMLRIIREVAPRYVVGENVRGLTNWNDGQVFDEVTTQLEAEGYEVRAFLLPACAVGAPHRRDRIWFVAHAHDKGTSAGRGQISQADGEVPKRNDHAQPGHPGEHHAAHAQGGGNCRGSAEICEPQRRPNGQQPAQPEQRGQVRPAAHPDHAGALHPLRGHSERPPQDEEQQRQPFAEPWPRGGAAAHARGADGEQEAGRERPEQEREGRAIRREPQTDGRGGNASATENTHAAAAHAAGFRDTPPPASGEPQSGGSDDHGHPRMWGSPTHGPNGLPAISRHGARSIPGWEAFPTEPPLCGGDDGLPTELDGVTFSKWRNESIKAYGNAIVPQVALQLFQAIEETERKLYTPRK